MVFVSVKEIIIRNLAAFVRITWWATWCVCVCMSVCVWGGGWQPMDVGGAGETYVSIASQVHGRCNNLYT